ncbi:hypothetical protein NGRA_1389 [Nosema granulosis]|uniref:Uncharacterized protein n=1 Tax=Nosema granulosis TaxID=83296 RepID=A0A9P6GZ23_9MICR|nr:hypothetical protein NGRA_1389 [Nosema granulosis]
MLILSNCNYEEEIDFEVKEVENKKYLEGKLDDIKFIAVEQELPVNFIVVESTDSNIISLENAKESSLYVMEVVYETGIEQEEDQNVYDLVNTFGTKRSIGNVKNMEIHGKLKTTVTVIESKTQILPPINTEAATPIDSFVLEDMFGQDIVEHFEKLEMEDISLQEELKEFTQKDKVRYLLSDAIIKVLKFKYYTRDMLEDTPYEPLMSLFIDDIEQRRLSKLAKDKLLIMLYILLLQMEGGVIKTKIIPSFNMNHKALIHLFKVIGCIYNERKKEVKWIYKPKDISRIVL